MTSTTTKPTIDSGANWSTITEEFAKQMGWKNNKDTLSQNTNRAISSIVQQVSSKKIQISICQLLKIVKLEIWQEIVNSIAIPDISRRKRTSCKAKRKKKIFNDTASESPSTSESEQDSESDIEISE